MLEDQSLGSLEAVWENKLFMGAGSESKKDWLSLSLSLLGQWLSWCSGVWESWKWDEPCYGGGGAVGERRRIKWKGGLKESAGFGC